MTTNRRRITLTRTWTASLEEVWALWTTKGGIEAWWGPEGFRVEVQSIDLRPGGLLRYAMIAAAPETIAFMQREGMQVSQACHLTYTEVEPLRRLAWLHSTDFIPGVAPYDVGSAVELHAVPGGVRLTLALDPMHDETWTGRAVAGWEMELGKLGRLLAARAG